MSETRRRPHKLYLAAAALLSAILLVVTVLWYVACYRLETNVREAAAAAGWGLAAGAANWGGWPAAAEITLTDVVVRAGPDVIPPLTWTATRADLRLSAWHPTVLTASASGTQTMTIGGSPPVPFTAQTLFATIDLTAHDPVRIIALSLGVTGPDGPVMVAATDLLVLPDGVSVDLSGMTLPGRAGQPIAPPIDALRLTGRIAPPIQPQPTASDSARRWRADDGKLDFESIALHWGPLDATGHATLELDEALQPVITGSVTAAGLGAVIEQLATTGAITRSAATAAKGMLAILSAPAGGGPVTLPVTLRDGIVSVARIPLLRLAPLRWD